ncbi:hypothetical protein MP228_009048 [Amoeboaphelidium protococcarum]|nr:hypothetical protein MP228_009048 [Amoeboaphelidium protococcarum]
MSSDNNGEVECVKKHFTEHEEFLTMLQLLIEDPIKSQSVVEDKLCTILDQYQSVPTLLDPHMDQIMSVVNNCLIESLQKETELVSVCKVIYALCKVRGYKIVRRYLPTDASCLVPLVTKLKSIGSLSDESSSWQIGYVFMLWMSVMVTIPLDIAKFGSYVMTDIIQVADFSLVHSVTAELNLAAEVKARLLSRQNDTKSFDLLNEQLCRFNDITLNAGSDSTYFILGQLRFWHLIFKHASQDQALQFSQSLSNLLNEQIVSSDLTRSNNLIRKGCVKLVKDIAMKNANTNQELVEQSLDYALTSLSDRDTIVRWTGAKAIAAIASRLNKGDDGKGEQDMQTEVVEMVLQLFTDSQQDDDDTMQGACLAIGELVRRKVLQSADHVQKCIPLLIKCLHFEKLKSIRYVGQAVRDAACYACWSFGRCPVLGAKDDDQQMCATLLTLLSHLFSVAVFDREINVRRAASAAFQELYGRYGGVDFGHDLINFCNFYSTSDRKKCFQRLYRALLENDQIREQFYVKMMSMVTHWDVQVRRDVMVAVSSFTCSYAYIMANHAVLILLEKVSSPLIAERHGSLLAIAAILQQMFDNEELAYYITEEVGAQLLIVPVRLLNEHQSYFTDSECGMFLEALSLFIDSIMNLQPLPSTEQKQTFKDCLQYGLQHPNREVKEQCAKAYGQRLFYPDFLTMEDYNLKLKDTNTNINERMGFALVCKYKKVACKDYFDEIFSALSSPIFKFMYLDKVLSGDRVELLEVCVQSIFGFCTNCCAEQYYELWNGHWSTVTCSKLFTSLTIELLQDILNSTLDNYTTDHRGDIGSKVRLESLHSMSRFVDALSCCTAKSIRALDWAWIVTKVIRLSVERIDSVRLAARQALITLSKHRWLEFDQKQQLKEICSQDDEDAFTYNLLTMLATESYRTELIKGLCYSVGSLSASHSNNVESMLIKYLSACGVTVLDQFSSDLMDLLQSEIENNRLSNSLLQTLHSLIVSQALDSYLLKNGRKCFDIVTSYLTNKPKDKQRLATGVRIYCLLEMYCDTFSRNLIVEIIRHLGHSAAQLRQVTQESMQLMLQLSENPKYHQASELLHQFDPYLPNADTKTLRREIALLLLK